MKLTKNTVDSMLKQGYTTKQLAEMFGCSVNKINQTKSRSGEIRSEIVLSQNNPIRKRELNQIRKNCRIGDKVRVYNPRRCTRNTNREWFGIMETVRIVAKFPYIVLLENGMTVDYAEIAMQRRNA